MPQPLVVFLTLISNLFFAGNAPAFFNLQPKVPEVDPIVEQISQMSLEDKVRQTLICSFEGKEASSALNVLKSCGNIFYSKGNLEGLSKKEIFENNQAIHRKDPRAWILIDQEGGQVARIKDGSPPPRKMAEENSISYWGQQHGRTLKDLGFNVDLAPVADITQNNPVIENRSFADDPTVNGQKITEYLKALQSEGTFGVIKHLPGHGRVDSDTHKKVGVLDYSWEEIKNFDLVPFVEAINSGAKLLMVGHIKIPEIASVPASISPEIISRLRAFLPGGSNLIFMTDSLSMSGVGLPQDQAAVEAIKAGEDMILIQGIPEDIVYKKLLDLYQNGTLDKASLDQSVTRILKIKTADESPTS